MISICLEVSLALKLGIVRDPLVVLATSEFKS